MNNNRKILIKNIISVTTALSIVMMSLSFSALFKQVDAAAVAIDVTSPANGEFSGAAAQDVSLQFIASQEFAISDTITLAVDPALGSALTDCGTATTDVDGDTTTDGAFGSYSVTNATYTFTAATTTATTQSDLCVQFPAGTAQGSYSITMSSTNGDFGGALVYVGDDNDVFVTAEVPLQLSFNIRTSADDADVNSCAIGIVDSVATAASGATKGTPDSTHECSYGLAIGTNATNGFTTTITSDGPMTNGTDNAANITNGGTFVAGTEAYGIVEVFVAETGGDGAGTFDQDISLVDTAGTAYATNVAAGDATPIPTSAVNFLTHNDAILYTAGTDNSDLTIVVHGMNASTTTSAGVYTQTVTYLVTPSF